ESCFVAGSRYRELADRPLAAHELAKLPLLLLSPGSSTRTFVEQWFAVRSLSVVPDIELGSIDLLLEFAKTGYGVAFLARAFAEEDLRAGRLWELRPDEP